MKKLFRGILSISLILLFSFISNIQAVNVTEAASFKDVKSGEWYYDYVSKLISLKITSGYTDGTYRPNNTVTRAEFVTFLCKTLGHEQAQGDPFMDTQKHWATGYVTIALANGIIDLPEDKKFRPDVPITRLEAVEMVCRAFNLTKDTKTTAFTDVQATENGYTNTVYNEYLMVGSVKDGKRYFYPKTNLKRSEVAAVVVNMVDYNTDRLAYKNSKIEEFKEKQEQEDAELARYEAWKESVKDIPAELLGNNQGLYKESLYLTNKYVYENSMYLENWGKEYNMSMDEFAQEIVRIGTNYGNTWANANYKELAKLENSLKSLWETNVVNNYLKRNLDYVTNYTLVSEGKFITSTGLIVVEENELLRLRGTMKCKYSSPTSINILNADVVGSTGKHLEIGVWYEQDFQISFYPEKQGLKVTAMRGISDIRISK